MNPQPDTPRPGSGPRAYLITVSCYGHRLHGHPNGSIDRSHNQPGTRLLDPDPGRLKTELRLMIQDPYKLDRKRRRIVLDAVQEVCAYRKWPLHAAQVRQDHVHAVISSDARPERVMNDLKAYASRLLNKTGWDEENRRRWSRHGSTKYLWRNDQLSDAVDYVIGGQGEPMDLYHNPNPFPR